jgi:hypothetical protein
MVKTSAFIAAMMISTFAFGNPGVFDGSGQTIKLIRSEDVQMKSEKVIITPMRGPFLFDGSLVSCDRADYDCTYVLHNRSKKEVSIQVGFPLRSWVFPTMSGKAEDVTERVLHYKFIARDEKNTYHVRFASKDAEEKLGTIFLWDMTLAPQESRTLRVAYVMPMYWELATMYADLTKMTKDKLWLVLKLPFGIEEGLSYVTETGNSWAGPIEDAEFEVRLSGFEQYLKKRPISEASIPFSRFAMNTASTNDKSADKSTTAKVKENAQDTLPITECHIHRKITPDGWQEKDGVIRWHYKNFRPKDEIEIKYISAPLPKNPDDLPGFTRYLFDGKGTKEDWGELRELFLALWGIKPKSELILQFVSAQKWYSPEKDMTAEKLSADQKAFLAEFDRLAKNVK